MKIKTSFITVNALGVALFVVTSLAFPIRLIGNYFLLLGYAVLTIYCHCFGKYSGMIVGGLGTLLYCLVASSFNGMIGWVIGDILIGFVLGTVFQKTKTMSLVKRYIINIIATLASCAAAFLLIKPLIETVMFKIAFPLRMAANMPAFGLDSLMIIISLPLCDVMEKIIRKK
ncbi:MAG: ECF transporter S component [Erysipelotrichaceae bacterium]|nr:ECF transporter S component [Erysipelotrichaceae bacterium]